MSFEQYRARHPNVKQKPKDVPPKFEPKASKLTPEQAAARKAAIFAPRPKGERVQKIIAASGLCSRRAAEVLIEQGRVTVNGKVIAIGASATQTDKVAVNGVPIEQEKHRYIVLHKPKGYVTTLDDVYGDKTVMDLIAEEERIYPIGRLDKDTTGLLLLTNDGDFANFIMHPRYEMEKTYIATLDKPFDTKLIEVYAKGVKLKDGYVKAKIRKLQSNKVSVTLHQGLNHIVKRIMKEHGYWVRDLSRISIGPLKLNIPIGAYRELSEAEINALRDYKPAKSAPPKKTQGNYRARKKR